VIRLDENVRTLQFDLIESVNGERIVKSLELMAENSKDIRFRCIHVSIHNASNPSSEIKTYKDATLVWKNHIIKIHPKDNEDFSSEIEYDKIVFEFNRELEDKRSFDEILNKFKLALKNKPDLKNIVKELPISTPESDKRLAPKPIEKVEFSMKRKFTILALVHGEFGKRKVKNLREKGPDYWVVESLELPSDLPTLIDNPQEYLPEKVSQADLVLALQENATAAQLIVNYVKLSGAKALLAPIDNSEWLPEGQKNQIQRQLASIGIESAFPRPFCVFEECGNPYLDEFSKHFGKPVFKIHWELDNVTSVEVIRGSPCGCSEFVAEKLKGIRVDEAVEIGGLAHHHYPCLAAMMREPDIDDTLMHKSGFMTKQAIDKEIEPYKKKHSTYLDPSGLK